MFVKLKKSIKTTKTTSNPLTSSTAFALSSSLSLSSKWVTYSYYKKSLKFSLATKMSSSTWSTTIIAAFILFIMILTPSVNGLNSAVDERDGRKLFGGYRITPKFCRASKTLPKSDPRSTGPTICMFNHECAQRNGEVVGACMDGFLFGACCQVPGIIDTSLILPQNSPQIQQTHVTSSSNLAAAYESYGSQQATSSEQNFGNTNGNGGYFGASAGELENDALENVDNNYSPNQNNLDNKKTNQFYVEEESVLVSSPSTLNKFGSTKFPRPQQHGSYSTELPMKIPSPQYIGGSHETVTHHHHQQQQQNSKITTTTRPSKINPNDILNNGEFTHSDITHPGAESVLIETNDNDNDDLQFSTGYGPSTIFIPAPENLPKTTTEVIKDVTQKISHKKPSFKPKPTINLSTKKPNDYVLVQTITNSGTVQKQPSKRPTIIEDTMTTNNIESIESIILMLNESNHGPQYNLINSTTESMAQVTFGSTYGTQRPPIPTNIDKYNPPNNYYFTTNRPVSELNTLPPPTTTSNINPTVFTGSGTLISTRFPVTTVHTPPLKDTTTIITTKRPLIQSTSHYSVVTTTNRPVIITSGGTKRPTITAHKKPSRLPSGKPARPAVQNIDEIIITPTRKPGTRRPIKNPPSTSYVTGPTPPRLPTTFTYGGTSTTSTTSSSDDTKIEINGGGNEGLTTNSAYSTPQYVSSTQKITVVEQNDGYKPIYVEIPQVTNTQRPHPTVIITPKPTSGNIAAVTSPWSAQQRPNMKNKFSTPTTTTNPKQPSTSYIYSPIVTRRPEFSSSTNEYVSLPPISSNDFDDPGYYGIQHTSVNTNRPFFDLYNQQQLQQNGGNYPGYFGSTPTYSTFYAPTVDGDEQEEETYTSPNDFVNFPPVRNPNLNMSATSSAVTNDFDMSTPSFVQDDVLKDKMSLLVNKIVSSLQGNFEALADLVEDDNNNNSTKAQQLPSTTRPSSKRPQTKLTTTKRPPLTKVTVKPVRQTTQKPSSSSSGTKRPATTKKTVVTKKPTVTRRPAPYTTRKPIKPSKKATTTTTTTTTIAPEDEIIEENDEDNEIDEDDSAEQTRKIQCGVRPHVKSGRIVGGKGAVFAEWPWQVLVRESTWLGLFTKNKCGGVLITNKFVMTAAHCQPGFLASLVAVFGEFDISGDLETKRSVTKNVKRVIVHRQYDAATFENDLALLELESAINYDTHIVPICMPSDIADFTGRMATVTGWGRLKYGGGVPSVLQEVQVPIIENSVCQEMFHTAGHNKKILNSFLCAGYANGQKDSCEGDSGGPLVLQRSDGRWELAGTVSHGIKCAAPYLPGVYMRTTFYKPWLRSVTGVK